jgi:hypothetical protein
MKHDNSSEASIVNRAILAALLPVIALILYIEGQSYDSALIQFKSSETSVQIGTSFFPDNIEMFSRAGRLRVYTKENLYEYINGHADFFITSGFVRLTVGEYAKTGSPQEQSDAVVDIYDMGKSIHAFGILSDEAGETPLNANLGSLGFKTSEGANFIKGKYYVKISVFTDSFPVDSLAGMINRNIGSDSDSFPVFSRLPDIGEVVSTRFIKEAYRGLEFINNVIEREYKINDSSVQVFVVTGKKDDISRLVTSFTDFFKESEINYSKIERDDKMFYLIKDPYEGDWYMFPASDALFGMFGAVDDSMLNALAEGSKGGRQSD